MMLMLDGIRLRLRDWREDDLRSWRQWLQPQNRWHELDGPYYLRPDSRQIDEMIATTRERIRSNVLPTPRRSLVIATTDTDELIGVVTWYWESEETNWLSLGIVIFDPARWKQGLGYEALGLWCQYLFDALPEIVRLDLRTWSGNHGMMRLAQKLGFLLEARFRMARIVHGEYFDGLGFGVLRSEWDSRFPDGFSSSLTNVSGTGDTDSAFKEVYPLTPIGRLATELDIISRTLDKNLIDQE